MRRSRRRWPLLVVLVLGAAVGLPAFSAAPSRAAPSAPGLKTGPVAQGIALLAVSAVGKGEVYLAGDYGSVAAALSAAEARARAEKAAIQQVVIRGKIQSVQGTFRVRSKQELASAIILCTGTKAAAEAAVGQAASVLGLRADKITVRGMISGVSSRFGFDEKGKLASVWMSGRHPYSHTAAAGAEAMTQAKTVGVDTVYLSGTINRRHRTYIFDARGNRVGILRANIVYPSFREMWQNVEQTTGIGYYRIKFRNCYVAGKDEKLYEAGLVADHTDQVWATACGKDTTSAEGVLAQIQALQTVFGQTVRLACRVQTKPDRVIDGVFASEDAARLVSATVAGGAHRSAAEVQADLKALGSDLHLSDESIYLNATLSTTAGDKLKGTFWIERDRFTNARRLAAYIWEISGQEKDYKSVDEAASALRALSTSTGIDVEAIGLYARVGYTDKLAGEPALIEIEKVPHTQSQVVKATLRRRPFTLLVHVVTRSKLMAEHMKANVVDVPARCRVSGRFSGMMAMDVTGHATFTVPVGALKGTSGIASQVQEIGRVCQMEPTDVLLQGHLRTSDGRIVVGSFGLDSNQHVTFRGIGGELSTREQVVKLITAFAAATGLDAGNIELTGTFPLAGGTRVRCIFSLAPGDGAGGPSVAIRLAGGIR